MTIRRCINCNRKIRAGTRCATCDAPRRAARDARRLVARPDLRDAAEVERRRLAVAEHRTAHGAWCPGWRRDGHPAADLTADHIVAVAAGGDPAGPLVVLCRRCNAAKGSR